MSKTAVGTKVTGASYSDVSSKITDGYHLVSSSVTGIPEGSGIAVSKTGVVTGNIGNGTAHVVYTIEKDPTPVAKKGSIEVTVKIKNADGTYTATSITDKKVMDSVAVGTTITGASYSDVPVSITKGYHIVSSSMSGIPEGSNIKLTNNVVTGDIAVGTPKVTYVIEKNPIPKPVIKTGGVEVTVRIKNADGTYTATTMTKDQVMHDAKVGTVITGASYSDVPSKITDGYTLVGTSISNIPEGSNIKVDSKTGKVTGDISVGTPSIVYTIEKKVKPIPPKPVVETGKVYVTVVTEGGTVLTKNHLVDTDTVGQPIKGAGYVPVKGYHLVKTTMNKIEVGTSKNPATNVTGKVTKADTQVMYVVEKDVVPVPPTPKPVVKNGSVTVEVVTSNGTVLTKTHDVLKDVKEGTSFSHNTDLILPSGYHYVSATLNGNAINKDAISGHSIEANKTQAVVYVVAKDIVPPTPKPKPVVEKGTVTVKVITTDGTIVTASHLVDTDIVGNKITGAGFTKIPGYTYVKVEGNPDGNVVKGNTEITYVVSKDPKPVPPTPVVKTGSVTVEIITDKGTVLTKTHDVLKDVKEGTPFAHNTDVTIPAGYHLVKTTLNGDSVSRDSLSGHSIEGGKTQAVVYIVAKDVIPPTPKPVKETGTVHVRVVTIGGTVVVQSHLVDTDIVGNKITGAGFTKIPGYTYVKVEGNPDGNVVKGDTLITYVVSKKSIPVPPTPVVKTGSVTVEVITTDGTVLTKEHSVMTDVPVKTAFGTSTSVEVPAGYHLVKITEGGNTVTANGLETSKVVEGTTHVVYVVTKDSTPTPVVKYGHVTVKVVTSTGKIVTDTHTVDTDVVGNKIKNTSIEVPDGYHLTKTEVNGSVVKTSNGITGNVVDGTTTIVYTITKDNVPPTPVVPPVTPVTPVPPTPVKPVVENGNVTVKVVTEDGKVIVTEHTVQSGTVGTSIDNPKYNVPAGYHIVETTVNGNKIDGKVTGKIVNGTTKVIYVIAKDVVPSIITPKVPEVITPYVPVAPAPVVPDTTYTSPLITKLPDTGLNYDGMGKEAGSALGLISLLGLGLGIFLRKKK